MPMSDDDFLVGYTAQIDQALAGMRDCVEKEEVTHCELTYLVAMAEVGASAMAVEVANLLADEMWPARRQRVLDRFAKNKNDVLVAMKGRRGSERDRINIVGHASALTVSLIRSRFEKYRASVAAARRKEKGD